MTDAEWAAFMARVPERKRRLFAVACVRRAEWLTHYAIGEGRRAYRAALDAAERYADGDATLTELAHAHLRADDNVFANIPLVLGRGRTRAANPFRDVAAADEATVGDIGNQVLLLARHFGLSPAAAGGSRRERAAAVKAERAAQADILRDLLGDGPPAAFDPAWRTESAVGLAEAAYNRRDFAALPILADAIEEAGCDDARLLAHLRGAGPHVRGCWAVDAVLGRS